MTLGAQYETLAGLPPSEKDYCALVTDETMVFCKLIFPNQTLNLRRPRGLPPARDTRPIIVEEVAEEEDEEDETAEVPLVKNRKRNLEVAQGMDEERIQSGAAAGPSGQGNPYLFKNIDRATADPRLGRYNPRQLVQRHQRDPDLNTLILHCVDRLVLDHQESRPRGTVVVDNTLAFRSILFEEYGTNLRTWPSLQRGIYAPGLRQYVEESSPDSEPGPELAPIREIIVLGSSSSGGKAPLVFAHFLYLTLCPCLYGC